MGDSVTIFFDVNTDNRPNSGLKILLTGSNAVGIVQPKIGAILVNLRVQLVEQGKGDSTALKDQHTYQNIHIH